MRNFKHIALVLFFVSHALLFAQGEKETLLEGIYNDPSLETQTAFVEELLYVAGYLPEQIEVYQTLPNNAHVFKVTLDSVNGGFLFVRWDKTKKQHFVANKQIDPGFYYNLKTAKEVLRKQTNQASFSVEDIAIQAPDQEKIGNLDIKELRKIYSQKEKNRMRPPQEKEKFQKEQRRIERKSSRKKVKSVKTYFY